jgi:hypothetical protein
MIKHILEPQISRKSFKKIKKDEAMLVQFFGNVMHLFYNKYLNMLQESENIILDRDVIHVDFDDVDVVAHYIDKLDFAFSCACTRVSSDFDDPRICSVGIDAYEKLFNKCSKLLAEKAEMESEICELEATITKLKKKYVKMERKYITGGGRSRHNRHSRRDSNDSIPRLADYPNLLDE